MRLEQGGNVGDETKVSLRACWRCGSRPALSQEARAGSTFTEYNVGHRCPDGLVSRGARGFDRDAVIGAWNRQQAESAVDNLIAVNEEAWRGVNLEGYMNEIRGRD